MARFTAQLVFFEVGAGSLHLDCLGSRTAEVPVMPGPPAVPFSMVVAQPGASWMAPALVSLGRWAQDGGALVVELTRRGRRTQATVSDRTTTAVFDVLRLDAAPAPAA